MSSHNWRVREQEMNTLCYTVHDNFAIKDFSIN